MNETAKRMLTDYGWWMKRLKPNAVRTAEMKRIREALGSMKG